MANWTYGALRVVEVAIEPLTVADNEKLHGAMEGLGRKDPYFGWSIDPESGQMILQGTTDEHLDHKIDVLKRGHGVNLNVGSPQVAYRETITEPATIKQVHAKQFGGRDEFASIVLAFAPTERGSGFRFVNQADVGSVPAAFVPGVERGLLAARANGLLAGFPVTDLQVTLIGGAHHDLDSSEAIFEQAARAAFRNLPDHVNPVLLEPIMRLEVIAGAGHIDGIVFNLKYRRGRIESVEPRGPAKVITALVPMSQLFGYRAVLRVFSDGHGQFTMAYDHLGVVPGPSRDDDPRFPPAAAMRA